MSRITSRLSTPSYNSICNFLLRLCFHVSHIENQIKQKQKISKKRIMYFFVNETTRLKRSIQQKQLCATIKLHSENQF